jgi:hypothetical protein
MHLTNEDLNHIRTLIDPDASTFEYELAEKIDEFIHYHEHDIPCPHCDGGGRVPEDFLTEEHVAEVFADYCDIFGYHLAYGVESYHEGGWYDSKTVHVVQDISARQCHNSRSHELPRTYFTRDVEKRRRLMTADVTDERRKAELKKQQEEKERIAYLETELATLKGKTG